MHHPSNMVSYGTPQPTHFGDTQNIIWLGDLLPETWSLGVGWIPPKRRDSLGSPGRWLPCCHSIAEGTDPPSLHQSVYHSWISIISGSCSSFRSFGALYLCVSWQSRGTPKSCKQPQTMVETPAITKDSDVRVPTKKSKTLEQRNIKNCLLYPINHQPSRWAWFPLLCEFLYIHN